MDRRITLSDGKIVELKAPPTLKPVASTPQLPPAEQRPADESDRRDAAK